MTVPVDRPPLDPDEQKELLLEDSERRAADRNAAPDSFVEHRTSDVATPPVERPAPAKEGYEAAIRYLGGGLRCGDCTATHPVEAWHIDEVRLGSGPDALFVAGRCPRCGAAGLLQGDDLDEAEGAELVQSLERGAG